jgi:hypothetical protein
MQENILNSTINAEPTDLPRRSFLRNCALGGFGAAVLFETTALGQPDDTDKCNGLIASGMLSLYSGLAFQLPYKLESTVKSYDKEMALYNEFNKRYQELYALAKQLRMRCNKLSKTYPQVKEIADLANTGKNNVQYLKTAASIQDKNIAYLHLATLVVASKQIARTANEITPEASESRDDSLICRILEKIRRLEEIKIELDKARDEFKGVFLDFTGTLSKLNKTIVSASQTAAKAERGEGGTDAALANIKAAEVILDDMAKQIKEFKAAHPGKDPREGKLTPEELNMLIQVPKAILQNEIPQPPISWRQPGREPGFQNAAYNPSAPASVYWQIYGIIANHVVPSDGWHVYSLALACYGVMRKFGDDPPRTNLIRSTLRTYPWITNLGSAVSLLAEMRV